MGVLLTACVKPVQPEFRFRDGILLVDGRLSDVVGKSEVRISRARLDGAVYRIEAAEMERVSSVDDSGNEVNWILSLDGERYRPPTGFRGLAGREYHLRIVDRSGRVYTSANERMPERVSINNFRSSFAQEAYFSDELQRFVPAFRLLVDLDDPEDQVDHYRFRYLSWEKLAVCVSCNFGQFNAAAGACESTPQSRQIPRYDYGCATDCWERTEYADFSLLSDEFINGNSLTGFEIGRINYDWFGPLLIVAEIEQLSADAHAYYRVLREQSLGSGGLNATLPAALDGNVDALGQSTGAILGYFAVVSTLEERVYFNRDTVDGTPLPFDGTYNFDVPSPPAVAYLHPCEGPNRSSSRPVGWPQ